MEGSIFGMDSTRNLFYITADLSEEQAYAFCTKSLEKLPPGLTLVESSISPVTFTMGNTTIEKGQFFARFKADSDILEKIKGGSLQMVLKSEDSQNQNNYGYKMPTEQENIQPPQQEDYKRYDFFKISKFAPGTTQGTLLNLIDKANTEPTETIMLEVPYDSMMNDIDTLSKSKFSFVEKGISGKDLQHEDYILNYYTEPDTKRAFVKFSPYLEML